MPLSKSFWISLSVVGLVGCATTPLTPTVPETARPNFLPPLIIKPKGSGERMDAAVAALPGVAVDSTASIAPGWEPYILHRSKRLTNYTTDLRQQVPSVKAQAISSASGWLARVNIDPVEKPMLGWSWKVDRLIEGADVRQRATEDSPVRIVLAFDGDKSQLPITDQAFFERAKLLTGRDFPYATLMYVWENQVPVNAIVPNPHTPRIQKLVVRSGPEGIGQWQRFERNIVEDYRRAFGKAPGRLLGVAILTDTDNTQSKATAWYGNIELNPPRVK